MTPAGTTKRILIIEDHVDVADIEKLLCQMEGYEVRVASNAVDGWTQILAFKPDLILLDLMLPGEISGNDLLKRIRAEDKGDGPPVLVVSALINPTTAPKLEDGKVTTMGKPFKINDLAARVETILRQTAEHG